MLNRRAGRVGDPALRVYHCDVRRMDPCTLLSDLVPSGATLDVAVAAHAVHGHLITVTPKGVSDVDRPALEAQLHERLNPLVMRHEVDWQ